MTSAPRPGRGAAGAAVRPRATGFSLVELMVVLVFLSIGILALSGVQTSASRDVYKTGRRTRAIALAQNRMEFTRGMGYGNAVPDSGQSEIFTWNTRVDSVGSALQRIQVTVTWPEQGQPTSVQLVDLISGR